AAGLRLAVLSLRGHVDVAQFVATFSGSHRYVLDYLTEEVLDRQPERVRTFLLETSVLDRLSGPLCDAVTGRADGQAMLEAVEAAGLFLMPLDDVAAGGVTTSCSQTSSAPACSRSVPTALRCCTGMPLSGISSTGCPTM